MKNMLKILYININIYDNIMKIQKVYIQILVNKYDKLINKLSKLFYI